MRPVQAALAGPHTTPQIQRNRKTWTDGGRIQGKITSRGDSDFVRTDKRPKLTR